MTANQPRRKSHRARIAELLQVSRQAVYALEARHGGPEIWQAPIQLMARIISNPYFSRSKIALALADEGTRRELTRIATHIPIDQ